MQVRTRWQHTLAPTKEEMADDKATDERRFNFSSMLLAALDEICSEGFQRKQPALSEASNHTFVGHAALAAQCLRLAATAAAPSNFAASIGCF